VIDPFFTVDQRRLRCELRHWVEREIFPLSGSEGDEDQAALRYVSMLADRGLLAYVAERTFGGVRERVESRDLCVIREELARGSALADVMFAIQGLGSYPITLAGTADQKKRYLPGVVCGRTVVAFALTEPEAGSDVAAIQTTAKRAGLGYRLNGVKTFITNAGLAKLNVVFARTDPKAGKHGISAFLVESDTPGSCLKERTQLISPHPIGALAFEDLEIGPEQLLGEEGDGLKIAFTTLDLFRATVGAAALGMAERALEEALLYAQRRKQFGRAISEFQATQFKLAAMATELEAARLLVHRAAWVRDTGSLDEVTQASAMGKVFATEAAQRIIDEALQIHGGIGLIKGMPIERLYRDIRSLRIYEGTSEIQKLIIARELLKGGKRDGL
jgi:acyl-CoA dehydrogenase